ncbi:MAG: sulfite exporter TauE/SafE family protein, partial [Nitrosopumilus sp.]|nr:sulfite exporter TauE/SafE family protein [Nitrosopumilus sp.]
MSIEILFGFFISIIAGVIGSMVGIGGGIVISPFLSYFNYAPPQISSTSLMSVFSTSLTSSFIYYRNKLISYKIGIIISIFSIPGTIFGVIISNFISLSDFKFYFAFILIGTSIYLVLKTKLKKNINKDPAFSSIKNKSDISYLKIILLVTFSFFAGILSSSFGIGGGIIFVPLLIILYGMKMNHAAATSQFALVFTSFAGLALYIYYGYPNYSMGIILAIGSLIGGAIGSKLSQKINSSILIKIFSFILIIVSMK